MTLAEEIRQKYSKPHYTFDDVVNEIRSHVIAVYEDVAKNKFSYWPGFNFTFFNNVPEMKWDIGREVSCTHWLIIPENSIDFDWRKISKWFEEQGFVHTTNEFSRCKSWRIKF